MAKKTTGSKTDKSEQAAKAAEQENLLRSLRTHGQVVESDTPNVDLKPGETHVYVKPSGDQPGELIEKRKSFFKR